MSRRARRPIAFPWTRREWLRDDAKSLPGGWLDTMARHAEWERSGRLGGGRPNPSRWRGFFAVLARRIRAAAKRRNP